MLFYSPSLCEFVIVSDKTHNFFVNSGAFLGDMAAMKSWHLTSCSFTITGLLSINKSISVFVHFLFACLQINIFAFLFVLFIFFFRWGRSLMAVERSSKCGSTFAKKLHFCKFERGAPGAEDIILNFRKKKSQQF